MERLRKVHVYQEQKKENPENEELVNNNVEEEFLKEYMTDKDRLT